MRWLRIAGLVGGLALVGTGGYLASAALSQTGEPTRTVTVEVGTGEQGPAGPPGATGPQGATGPAGPEGATTCPAGFQLGDVVFIQQGAGPTTIRTCIKND